MFYARLNQRANNNRQKRALSSLITNFIYNHYLWLKTQYAFKAMGLNCHYLTNNGNRQNITCYRMLVFDCYAQHLKLFILIKFALTSNCERIVVQANYLSVF